MPFLPCEKNSKLKEKTKTQAENSNFRHFFKKKLYSLKTYHHTNISLRTKLLSIAVTSFSTVATKNKEAKL